MNRKLEAQQADITNATQLLLLVNKQASDLLFIKRAGLPG